MPKNGFIIHECNHGQITLDSLVVDNGSGWSQGNQQLVVLARALVKKSTLIILNEATPSVDFDTEYKVQ